MLRISRRLLHAPPWASSNLTLLPRRAAAPRTTLSSKSFSTAPTGATPPHLIRNVAIIAHIDHGKTTICDRLMGSSAVTAERVMDSMSLEKQRGITIMSKYTRVDFQGHVLNVVDTPGHADFGGEVERVLDMCSGCCLIVCGTEGPMAQSKYVLSKAIEHNLKPIVVINKVDREGARPHEVESEVLDLFISLGAPDELLDYPVLFASAREGWAVRDMDDTDHSRGMAPLLEAIVETVPAPCGPEALAEPFTFAVNSLQTDNFVGRVCLGKVHTGQVKIGDPIKALSREEDGKVLQEGKVTKLFCQRGMDKQEVQQGNAGDILWLAGVEANVADTISAPEVMAPLHTQKMDPPTLAITFSANDSPLAGKEGKFVTGSHVINRLHKEVENNVSITLVPSSEPESIEVHGRGELQLGIIIETMRREGFELCVSPPKVLTKKCPTTGKTLEPVEEVTVDVDQELSGVVVEKLSARKGHLVHFGDHRGKSRLVFHVPSRGLLGFMNEIKTDTRGSAVVTRLFLEHKASVGQIDALFRGKLISMERGSATAYALNMLEERGVLFVQPGEEVYPGMIIGEHNRPVDLDVNPTKGKKLSNVRSVSADEAIRLTPPVVRVLEEYLAYMNEDEKLEVTPLKMRLRKRELDPGVRARKAKSGGKK